MLNPQVLLASGIAIFYVSHSRLVEIVLATSVTEILAIPYVILREPMFVKT
jgi:hypothetical protein